MSNPCENLGSRTHRIKHFFVINKHFFPIKMLNFAVCERAPPGLTGTVQDDRPGLNRWDGAFATVRTAQIPASVRWQMSVMAHAGTVLTWPGGAPAVVGLPAIF